MVPLCFVIFYLRVPSLTLSSSFEICGSGVLTGVELLFLPLPSVEVEESCLM